MRFSVTQVTGLFFLRRAALSLLLALVEGGKWGWRESWIDKMMIDLREKNSPSPKRGIFVSSPGQLTFLICYFLFFLTLEDTERPTTTY